jgi:hypothetical protein
MEVFSRTEISRLSLYQSEVSRETEPVGNSICLYDKELPHCEAVGLASLEL